jgi:hypothetical protein
MPEVVSHELRRKREQIVVLQNWNIFRFFRAVLFETSFQNLNTRPGNVLVNDFGTIINFMLENPHLRPPATAGAIRLDILKAS